MYVLIGRLAQPGSETEAFTWMSTAIVGGASLGLAAGGTLSASVGIAGPFVLAVAATLLAGLLTWILLPLEVQRQAVAHPQPGLRVT